MPTVNGVVSTPVGVVGGTVTATLVGTVAGQTVPVVGFFTTGTREIVTRVATTAADSTGAWSLSLPSNLDPNLSPSNTYYQVTETAAGSQSTFYIQVPNGAGPYWAGNIIVQPTTVSAPVAGLGLPVAVVGLPGATAPTRYAGGTTSGAPVTGTFAVGDFVIDETGRTWVCTAAGTPGTWVASVQTNVTQPGTIPAPTPTTVWTFQPRDPAKAPFQWIIGGASFAGTWDTVMYLGYNVADGGGRVVATEPQFYWAVEQDYNNGTHFVEAYWQFTNAAGTVTYRPVFLTFDRATGANTQFEIRSNGVTFTDHLTGAAIAGIGSTGISITPKAGQSATLTVGSVAGSQSAILVGGGSGPNLLIQQVTAGNSQWEFRIGPSQAMNLTSGGGIGFTGSQGIRIGETGNIQFWSDNTESAVIQALQNVSRTFRIGDTATWLGIDFFAGGATQPLRLGPTPSVGFYGTAPIAKPTVTGSKGANAALTSLMAQLAALGLVTDSTT